MKWKYKRRIETKYDKICVGHWEITQQYVDCERVNAPIKFRNAPSMSLSIAIWMRIRVQQKHIFWLSHCCGDDDDDNDVNDKYPFHRCCNCFHFFFFRLIDDGSVPLYFYAQSVKSMCGVYTTEHGDQQQINEGYTHKYSFTFSFSLSLSLFHFLSFTFCV